MKSFKIRGERLLSALDWVSRIDQERHRHPGCYLPESHPAYKLADRFRIQAFLGGISAQLIWPDVRDLLTRNPQLAVTELEIGGLIETLGKRYRYEQDNGPAWWRKDKPGFEPFEAFLNAVASGEVTEADLLA